MRSLDRALELGPSGLVFASSLGAPIARGYRDFLDLEKPIPISEDDSFDLASITKIFCTTAIMMDLIDQNQLSLSTRASSMLPNWKREKEAITIEDLLRHRSGLAPWRPLYIATSSIDGAYELIANQELASPINSMRAYSDLGFITLGQIITKITGLEIEAAFTKFIAEPLGLKKTQFRSPVTKPVSTSRGDRFEYEMVETKVPYNVPESVGDFHNWRDHILKGEVSDGNSFHLFGGAASHAGLFSTADEILKFASWIRSHRLYPTFTAPGPDPDCHLGFVSWESTVDGCSDHIFGHTGFTGVAFGASSQHCYEFVLLTNRTHTDGPLTLTTDLLRPVLDELHRTLH